jgi:protease-4
MSVGSTPEPRPARPIGEQNTPLMQVPPRVIVQLASSRWSRWWNWMSWTGFLLCGAMLIGQSLAFSEYFDTTGGIREKYHSGNKFGQQKIAILNISGIILDGEGYVKHQIERIQDDKSIKGIVVRVDSPGGTVTGSDYIYHHLKKLREETKLPLVVSMGSIATSGGYYVSMAVGDQKKAIYAEPTTTTGSIGVMIPHYDLSGLMEQFNVKDDSLATHPRKLMMSMTRPMTDDDRGVLERYMSESFNRFIDIVHAGRPALKDAPGKLEHAGQNLATGEIFTAQQAKSFGLIDEIGFIEDAIARCSQLAGVDKDDVRVVEYERLATLADALTGSLTSSRSSESPLGQLLEGSTPRMYYLFTLLPPLVTTAR